MKNEEFPFLMIDRKKSNMDEDYPDFSAKKYKNFNKPEKFKPKVVNNPEKSQNIIKGAENKVKSMLSIFLKDYEKDNIDYPKNINKIGQKDMSTNKFKFNAKRNSIFSNTSSNKFNFESNINSNKMNSNGNINENIAYNINHQKKIDFNLSITNKLKNISGNTSNNIESGYSLKKKNRIKNRDNKSLQEVNNLILGNALKSRNKINYKRTQSFNSQKSKHSNVSCLDKNNINIKKSNNFIKRKKTNKSDENNAHTLIRKKTSFLKKNNMYENDSVIKKNKNINNKNSIKTKLKSSNVNKKNKNKNQNNIFNDSFSYNNSIMSDGSDCNIIQKSFERGKKISSTSVFKDSLSILSKKNSSVIMRNNNKNNTIKTNSKFPSEIKRFKRSTTFYGGKNKFINNKALRHNIKFKTIKKQLFNSIIIRPEDLEIKLKENRKSSNKNFLNLPVNQKNKKNDKKSRSVINLIKVDKNIRNINFVKINKNEKSRKNNSCINNIVVQVPKKEKIAKSDKIKIKESEKKIDEKENASKDSSSDEYSKHSIRRQNEMYNQKYRILIHKGPLYDSLDDEEFEDIDDEGSLYLNPNSKFILFFDSLLIFSGTISFICVPIYLAGTHDFCNETRKVLFFPVINLFSEILNLLDLFLGFFRGYYNWEEQLIHNNKTIIKNYITGWFLFDLIAAVPVYSINKLQEPNCREIIATRYYNIILDNPHYLLICNRILKIFKIFDYNQAWKILSNKLNDSASFIIYALLAIFSLNYFACLYIFIARNNYPNWILHTNLDTSSFYDIYVCSIYILIMAITSVGYGDITCYCFWEVVFQLFLLIVGIMAYSWAVSSFSNYVQKINEKSADFEKKKSFLDEIKLNNPNLPEELYEKILRFLKFKNFHEKKLKNIIFECLPVSLKNNLICEMYKPIINNFIFFKNFQNTDFIVNVILAFKPVIAMKNDILINDNDLVEDIMFVKQGILSVELPINISNPQENINKYLDMPILRSQSELDSKRGTSMFLSSKLNSVKNSKFKSTIDKNSGFTNSNVFESGIGQSIFSNTFGNKQTISDKEKEKEEIRYVRILGIRKNEHFGDVMMFLEQRSPLRVRVKSKKSELYFLKKMDAIKISTSFPHIWTRINKKSVFNFEQIKKSIKKIVELYSSAKRLNSIDEEDSSENTYDEIIRQSQIGLKESVNNLKSKNYDLNNSALDSKKDIINIKRSYSLKKGSDNFMYKLSKKNNFEITNNLNTKRKTYSSNKITNNLNLNLNINNNEHKLLLNSSSSSSSQKYDNKKKRKSKNKNKNSKKKKSTLNKKLIDTFNGKYKYYKKTNNKVQKESIIKEEPSQEGSLSQMRYTKSFKKLTKYSLPSKNNNYKYMSSIKRNSNKKFFGENNSLMENTKISRNNLDKYFKSIKYDESSSLQLINDEKYYIRENSDENNSNELSYDKVINDEIYPGEEIKINNNENLLMKKIDLKNILNQSYINNFDAINKESKKEKLQILLNSLDSSEKKDNINKNININNNITIINDNNISNKLSNTINNESSNFMDTLSNKILIKKRIWDKDSLSVSTDISFEFNSSYENCNSLCCDKLIKSKSNQEKLKKFLIDEILNGNMSNNNSFVELIHNKTTTTEFQSQIKQKDKREVSTIINSRNTQIINKGKKRFRKCSSVVGDVNGFNNNNFRSINRTSSFNEINIRKNRFIKNDFDIDPNNNNYYPGRKVNKIIKKNVFSTKALTGLNINNSPKEGKKKVTNKLSSMMLSSFNKPKKKKDNLLSQINFNIQKTNQNLNNPDEFYSNYFNFLLEGEMGSKNNNNIGTSMKAMPKIKKEKKII